jgi:hypothetical protein
VLAELSVVADVEVVGVSVDLVGESIWFASEVLSCSTGSSRRGFFAIDSSSRTNCK